MKKFPAEKFGIISQTGRASLSVHRNIAEGCARKSLMECNRFYKIERGSLVEVDIFDVAVGPGSISISEKEPEDTGSQLIRCFQLISKTMS